MPPRARARQPKTVSTLRHKEASRPNIPTAEYQPAMTDDEQRAIPVTYPRNTDLDPQLVWRGKDEQDQSDLIAHAPPLYIQEKVHPKVLIADLMATSRATEQQPQYTQPDLFADFNGLPDGADRTDFYQHEGNWSNRMILGDSLQVMASLAEREGLRGKVQCIYLDPPYGIKFNSNFQWSTTSRDVRDGNAAHVTREPEQVKAFRDTWRDGIHSYLSYLRDRLTVARDLLAESGSIFVQIGDENVHRVRAVMDEVFGEDNFVCMIAYTTTSGFTSNTLSRIGDYILWYSKQIQTIKYRQLFTQKLSPLNDGKTKYDQVELPDGNRRALTTQEKRGDLSLPDGARFYRHGGIDSQGSSGEATPFEFEGKTFSPPNGRHWTANYPLGMENLKNCRRLAIMGRRLSYVRYFNDFPIQPIHNLWTDIGGTVQSRSDPKVYVVQTGTAPVQRCILMTTDPGDLVLDPTCGSGTTAYVAEQWGRRWITVDTSRVALALARARIMGARYPYYLLADSQAGQQKEAELARRVPSEEKTYGDIRQGFVYQRAPHITLKSIANNAEIDVLWEQYERQLAPLREQLSEANGQSPLEEWEVPRERQADLPAETEPLLAKFWELRIARQREIDASIAAKADYEYLYDQPYEDRKTVRVAGQFTVESISPHRTLAVDADGEFVTGSAEQPGSSSQGYDFATVILDNLRTAGVQQAHKEDRIEFTSLTPWPGERVCAEGLVSDQDSRAAVFIGPEFGTVSRPDLVKAAREAAEAGFDLLIACAFNYDAHATELERLGRIPVLKARMNNDLHMANDLKNTGQGNLFVVFGEPDIAILDAPDGQVRVKVHGVDVFHPTTGEVRSDGPDGIACWFIDTDYNEESFFVRHAYFLGASNPYKSLKTTLKAEINAEAWATLKSDTSRPFPCPESGRIAVKVINHLGDEVMKVFRVASSQ